MRKFKRWLIQRILPVWAREELLKEIEQLREENERLRQKVALRDEYIDGLRDGIRHQRRIVVNAGEVAKK
jgi:cell division septum initiation protein DivIVA